MIHDVFMLRCNSIVIPGNKVRLAIHSVFALILENMMQKRRRLLYAR